MRNPYARIEKHCNRLASSTIPGIALGSEVASSTLSHLLVNPTHHLALIGPHVSLPHPGFFPLDMFLPVVVAGPLELLLGQRRVPPVGIVDLELLSGVNPGHHLVVV